MRWLVVAVSSLLVAAGGLVAGGRHVATAPPTARRYWIVEAAALDQLVASRAARAALAGDVVFVVGRRAQLSPAARRLRVVPTETFTSEAALVRAVATRTIPPGTRALLYDNETWPLTPPAEIAHPLHYYEAAAAVAHDAGYSLVATPVSVVDPRIAVQVAPYVDVLDIQSQYDQAAAGAYAGHVLPLAVAARRANRRLVVLSGLSTNPAAGVPTPRQLLDDAVAAAPLVQGFWLNVPVRGVSCPRCLPLHPGVGRAFLGMLGRLPWPPRA